MITTGNEQGRNGCKKKEEVHWRPFYSPCGELLCDLVCVCVQITVIQYVSWLCFILTAERGEASSGGYSGSAEGCLGKGKGVSANLCSLTEHLTGSTLAAHYPSMPRERGGGR